MLEFEPFSVEALKRALRYIRNNPSLCSDISAGYLYMWQEGDDVSFCVLNGTFCVRQNIGGQPAFSYPFGADPDGMVEEIRKYVESAGLPLRFFAVDDETLEKIIAEGRLKPLMYAYERQWSDYIYSFEEAATFKGKKFSGQRNHINKFRSLYGEPDIRFLTDEDRPAVGSFFSKYLAGRPDAGRFEMLEFERGKALYEKCGELGMYAAGLFVGEQLAAVSVGEITGRMLIIHVEKALKDFEGIYPAVFSGFVKLVGGLPEAAGLKFVNREDDSGDPGLRTSKTQYHPVRMANKYLVHVNSPAFRADPHAVLRNGNVFLTEIRENDRAAYLRLNTDVESNRYWGYDYREDPYIILPVDENTFYDSVIYDTAAGDSVNFAVRLSGNGEMIGEALLWNFSYCGRAEIGCRIFPEYRNSGYGKDAFGAAAGYAVKLGLKPFARCHRDNIPSLRMITSNGFVKTGEDGDLLLFGLPVNNDA